MDRRCCVVVVLGRVVGTFVLLLLLAALKIGDCREALRPPADVESLLKDIPTPTVILHEGNASPCLVNVQKDLPKPNQSQPLYLIPQKDRIWLPNAKGYLQVPYGANIELYCASTFANVTTTDGQTLRIPKNTRTVQLTCLYNQTFVLKGQQYEFRHLVCAKPAKYTVERTGRSCADNAAQLYRIGFNVTGNRFIETMQICHNDDTLQAHYTVHRLEPANIHYQQHVPRLNFSKAGYFHEHNMNFYYTQKNQRAQAERLLGAAHSQYFDGVQFLARGHLAAKADMVYATQQRSTFNFFNVAPQWQSFNGGHWATLEDEVRKFVAKAQLEVDCYTGTWGVMELPLQNGARAPLYLAYDANNNGVLPVPLLYYRVIVDRQRPQRGLALVGVNNPHASMEEIRATFVICADVQAQVSWLRWIRNKNLKKGYLYACRVSDLASAVKHLPTKLGEVNELLV